MAFGDWVQGANKDQSTSVTSTTISYGSNVTAGNTLLLHLRRGGSVADDVTVSDNLNGSWTNKDKSLQVTSSGLHQVWRFPATAGGACTITVSVGTSTSLRLVIQEYVGNFLLDAASTIAQGSSTTPSSGSITTTHTCRLIGSLTVGLNVGANANVATAGSNWTKKDECISVSSGFNRTATASEEWTAGVQAAGSFTADWTLPLSDNWGAAILGYYDGGAAAPAENWPPTVTYDPWAWTNQLEFFPDSEIDWTGTQDFDIPAPVHIFDAIPTVATSDVSVAGILYAGVHPLSVVSADRNLAGIAYVGAVPYGPVTADRTVAGIVHVGAPQISTVGHDATPVGILYSGPFALTSGGFDYITTGILYAAAVPMGTVSHTTSVAGILEAGVTPYSTVTHGANVAGILEAGITPFAPASHDTSVAGILHAAAFALNGPSFDYNVAGILYVGAAQRTTATADRTVAGIVHAGPFQMSTVTASRNVVGIVELGVHAVATVTRSTSVPGLLEVAVYARADLGPTVTLPGITDTVRRRDTGTILQVGTGTLRARQTGTMTGGGSTGTMRVRAVDSDSIQIL